MINTIMNFLIQELKIAMNKFAVLCLGLVAMATTVESCWEGCTIVKKYEMTMMGETTDVLSTMPDEAKQCTGDTVTCSSGSSCKSFTMTMTADMSVEEMVMNIDMDAETTMCAPDSVTSVTEFCSQSEESVEAMLGSILQNVNVECSDLRAASSSALGFGFGAFLVTIVYVLY